MSDGVMSGLISEIRPDDPTASRGGALRTHPAPRPDSRATVGARAATASAQGGSVRGRRPLPEGGVVGTPRGTLPLPAGAPTLHPGRAQGGACGRDRNRTGLWPRRKGSTRIEQGSGAGGAPRERVETREKNGAPTRPLWGRPQLELRSPPSLGPGAGSPKRRAVRGGGLPPWDTWDVLDTSS